MENVICPKCNSPDMQQVNIRHNVVYKCLSCLEEFYQMPDKSLVDRQRWYETMAEYH